jgi:hypothetical protein
MKIPWSAQLWHRPAGWPQWLPSPYWTSRIVATPAFRELCVDPFPAELRDAVLTRAAQADRETPRAQTTSPVAPGNCVCATTRTALDHIPWGLLESDAALKEQARRMSRRCAWSGNLDGMERIARGAGIEPPPLRFTRVGRLARLTCPMWWRRGLRRAWHRRAEESMRHFGLVLRGRAPYVTDWTRRRRRRFRRDMYAALRSAVVTSDYGAELSLLDVWKGSVSNLAVRRAELMTRLHGFETIASELGHVARFFTLTAPSAFHVYTTVNGEPKRNPNYRDEPVAEGQRWLLRQWARIRAKLKRDGILVYGFRIAEPHHDVTPHFHILFAGFELRNPSRLSNAYAQPRMAETGLVLSVRLAASALPGGLWFACGKNTRAGRIPMGTQERRGPRDFSGREVVLGPVSLCGRCGGT